MSRVAWLLALIAAAASADAAGRVLDDFRDASRWRVEHTDDVTAALAAVPDGAGRALRLDFDFTDARGAPVNGYATAHRDLPLEFPTNFEMSFRVRGEAPVNNLQFKLIDASGENVWWINRPDFVFTHDWQEVRIKRRQIDFAWGPTPDRSLRRTAAVEFVVSSGRDGGRGSVYFDHFAMRELPPEPATYPPPEASASSSPATAQNALSEAGTAPWCSDAALGSEQHYDIDFRIAREFGGLTLEWQPGRAATRYGVEFSDDGRKWRTVRRVLDGNGGSDPLRLAESETRYVRLALHAGQDDRYCLAHIAVEPLAFGASSNAFFAALAKRAPRGSYPRGFVEQPYWTIVGVDGGGAPALVSEDGAIEPVKGGSSIEPFLIVDGKLLTWADVAATQTLPDGYLPMPRVEWKTPHVELSIATFATGDRERSQLVATYRVANRDAIAHEVALALAVRPFQVNPPAQFLNSPGGASPIVDVAWDGHAVSVDGRAALVPLGKPDRFLAASFDAGSVIDRLRRNDLGATDTPMLHDESGYASAALVYRLSLAAQASREVAIVAPIRGPATTEPAQGDASTWAHREAERVAATWRARLDRVHLRLPASARRIADTLRTAHADILMTRDGAALRPGTRSYARSWIRDGAMIGDALLRLGDLDAVREYVDWYAPHQFANGKVPCCVDHRGADPVPENDSHGELIHAIAQLYRYGGDRSELARAWSHVDAAITYMDALRASQTGAANPAFKGLMPASISHEGYSAKPMHSYWDDFWALTGYKDAVEIASALDKRDAAARIAHSRDEFRGDLLASIALATKAHAIDYVPGCAELGDFDATSTTIALSPAGEQAALPQNLLQNTFARYWRDFAARADGSKTWEDYTPYEWRTVGTFVRLGERERAQAAVAFFFATGARPPGWNQWAEVVGRDPRKIRFIGDMPHGWVASDFIRSALDLFAYERESDHALVLAAGVPSDWLAGDGIAIEGLRTPYGALSYTLHQSGKRLELRIAKGAAPPGGFELDAPGAPARRIAAAPADITVDLDDEGGPRAH
ncbi:MAG TPA: discoidin domain-containing protein [Rudaea sp.]|nr:discoidin domain-containing protein [Rudaea sp.]